MFRFILIAVALPLLAARSLRIHEPAHAAAVAEAKATVVTHDHIHTMNKHLDEIKDRITKAMQDSVAESRESCADPSKSTEPTIETKEVQFVDGQQLENNDPSNLPLKAPLVLTEWTQIDGKKSWDTSRDLCTTQGQELCTYNQLCPNGKGNVPTGLSILTHLLSGDQWVPILPQKNGNKWIQAGTRAGGKCNPLSTYHGSKGSWMESTAYKPYKKWNVCCNIPIKTAPVVKTTIVGCDEKSSCATQTKDKEAIFDTKMNCISTKQSSIKSEKSIVVEQEECITKAKNGEFELSSDDQAIVARHEKQKEAHTKLLKALQDMRSHITSDGLAIPDKLKENFRFATKLATIEPRFKEMSLLVNEIMSTTGEETMAADVIKSLADLLDTLIKELRISLQLDTDASEVETKKSQLLKQREEEMVSICSKTKSESLIKISTFKEDMNTCEAELKVVANLQSEQLPTCISKHSNFQAQYKNHKNELAAVESMRKILNDHVESKVISSTAVKNAISGTVVTLAITETSLTNGWATYGTIPLLIDPETGKELSEEEAFALIKHQNGYGSSTGGRPDPNKCANPSSYKRKGFCGHDHKYQSSYIPLRGRPATEYIITYKKPVIVRGVRIIQHANGINCIQVKVGVVNVGSKCAGRIHGSGQWGPEFRVTDINGYKQKK